MKTKILAILLISTLSLSACSSDVNNPWGMGNKETIGTGLGAFIGGFFGSKVGKGNGQLLATGAGAALGAIAGSSIGKSLDQADLAYHQQAIEQSYSAPLDQTISWDNQDTGHSGTVTPIREGHQASTNNICRQYEQAITVDGQTETAVGTACQNDDGSWTIAN